MVEGGAVLTRKDPRKSNPRTKRTDWRFAARLLPRRGRDVFEISRIIIICLLISQRLLQQQPGFISVDAGRIFVIGNVILLSYLRPGPRIGNQQLPLIVLGGTSHVVIPTNCSVYPCVLIDLYPPLGLVHAAPLPG